jgi:hypothetical protein
MAESIEATEHERRQVSVQPNGMEAAR